MLIASLLTAICLFIPACFYLIRASNINRWDSDAKANNLDAVAGEVDHVYDTYPVLFCQTYHDPLLQVSLSANIIADCT